MSELIPTTESTDFPSESRLLHAALYVASAKFVDDTDERIQEALDVFDLEKQARIHRPIMAQDRITRFDAASQVNNIKRLKAKNEGNEKSAHDFEIKRITYLFAKVPDNAIAMLKAELETRNPNPVFDEQAFNDLPPIDRPDINLDPGTGTYPEEEK